MRTLVKNKSGFTLIELLMAMVTGIIVLAGIYAAFNSQQKIHTKESQVVDAEQNVRGAAHFMVREIRLAGMDQTGNAEAGFLIAGPHSIRFTLDSQCGHDEDVLDADEDITYRFSLPMQRIRMPMVCGFRRSPDCKSLPPDRRQISGRHPCPRLCLCV